MWILRNMSDRIRSFLGVGIFIVACTVLLYAIRRYTGYGLPDRAKLIPTEIFHLLIAGDIVLFYIQWKIYPFTWALIRYWFSNHIWTVVFVLAIVTIIQALLITRLHERLRMRYKASYEKIDDISFSVYQVEEKVDKMYRVIEDLEDINRQIEELSDEIKRLNKEQTNPQSTNTRRSWY